MKLPVFLKTFIFIPIFKFPYTHPFNLPNRKNCPTIPWKSKHPITKHKWHYPINLPVCILRNIDFAGLTSCLSSAREIDRVTKEAIARHTMSNNSSNNFTTVNADGDFLGINQSVAVESIFLLPCHFPKARVARYTQESGKKGKMHKKGRNEAHRGGVGNAVGE